MTLILILFWGSFLLSGCITHPDLGDAPNLLSEELRPAKLKTKVKLELGPGLLSLTKFGVHFSNSEAKKYLSDIRKIELGVYEVCDLPSQFKPILWEKIAHGMAQRGWEVLVKSREKGEVSLVFYRLRKRGRSWLYLINLDQTELVLVKIEGRLERLMEKAFQENGWNSNLL